MFKFIIQDTIFIKKWIFKNDNISDDKVKFIHHHVKIFADGEEKIEEKHFLAMI